MKRFSSVIKWACRRKNYLDFTVLTSKIYPQLTITLRMAFSSQTTSLDDTWVGLLPSSEIFVLEDIVTWEDPRAELSAFEFDIAAAVSKGVLTSFKESIFKWLSNRSLHIWSLNHSLWVKSVAFIIFISRGSSIPSLLPIATYPRFIRKKKKKNLNSYLC